MATTTNAQLMFKNNILQQTQKNVKIDKSHNYQHIHRFNGRQYSIKLSFYSGKASSKAS